MNIINSIFSRTWQIQKSRRSQLSNINHRFRRYWFAMVIIMIWSQQLKASSISSFEQVKAIANKRRADLIRIRLKSFIFTA